MLRGLVMVIMALDHAAISSPTLTPSPNRFDADKCSPVLTRWITPLAALFLYSLQGLALFCLFRGKTKKDLAVFLLSRGLCWFSRSFFSFTPLAGG